MRFLYVSLAAGFASLAAAQNATALVSQLPSCAYNCLIAAGQSSGCPDATDFSCFCGANKNLIVKSAVPCIGKGCSTVDALETQKIASKICLAEAPMISSLVSSISSSSAAAASSATPLSVSTTSSISSSSTSPSTSSSGSGSQTTTASGAAQTNGGPRLDVAGKVAAAMLVAALVL